MAHFIDLPCRDDHGAIRVVVETPRECSAKLKYDPTADAFTFQRALPLGVVYPFDWGFVPSTRAADDDPLDAMVLFDKPTWPGVVIPSRPLGLVRLVQRDGKGAEPVRNDRVIAVPSEDDRYEAVDDLPKRVRQEIEQFFITTTLMTSKKARIEGWAGPRAARKAIDLAARAYARRGNAKSE